MNEQQIKALIQQEIHKNQQIGKFGMYAVSRHVHNGIDSPSINQDNIIPGNSTAGNISFDQVTTYNIGTNFNPSNVLLHGNVTGSSVQKFFTIGNAKFGPSSYLQPVSTTSVAPGGTSGNIVQCSSYFGTDNGNVHLLASEEHVVDIFYSGTLFARATITGYSNKGIILVVDTLASGWEINLSWLIS